MQLIWKKPTYAQDPKGGERDQFVENPRLVILYVKQDRVLVAVWIDCTQDESSNQSAEERAP